MKPGPVFLDTGIFVAFLDRSDRYHDAAFELFADPPRRWCTSLAVVFETYGWFLHRLGEDAARTVRLLLGDLPRLEVLELNTSHAAHVSATLDRLRGHKLTWVDASSLVFLKERRIREVWGTDADLAIEGAIVRPR